MNKSQAVIVGVSGGIDSVSLLHMLLQKGFQKIIVAHLDHQIRKESPQDSAFVKKLAQQWKVKFILRRRNVPEISKKRKENLESTGREERYQFFRLLKKKYKASAIVTAHHADDQAETILMNIIRGCGLDGLCGMQEQEGDLWRPLLALSKKDISKYAKKNKLPFLKEPLLLEYRRNLLRKKIIPILKKINPGLLGTLQKNIAVWDEAAQYFRKKSSAFLKQYGGKKNLDRKAFLGLSKAEQMSILRLWYEKIHGQNKNLSSHHLEEIFHMLHGNISGKKKEFGPKYWIALKRNCLQLSS